MRTIAECFDWVLAHPNREFYMHNWSGKWFIEISRTVEVTLKEKGNHKYMGAVRVEARDFNDLQAALNHVIDEAEAKLGQGHDSDHSFYPAESV